MNVERLRKIIQFSISNKERVESKIKRFYAYVGMNHESEVLNILQISRDSFLKRGYMVLQIPFEDKEIEALTYKGDALGYILMNTSRPKVNVHFAICHELYHVYFQDKPFRSKVEFGADGYYEDEEEYAANLFAGMLLMPESSFRCMYNKFKKEMQGNEFDTVIQLMHYYKVPYMAALIRCYELELPDSGSIDERMLSVEQEDIRNRLLAHWLDPGILEASNQDDYPYLEKFVEMAGKDFVKNSYLNERTLKKVLENMRVLYAEIKGA